jgi:hypothetical protein
VHGTGDAQTEKGFIFDPRKPETAAREMLWLRW